MIAETEEYFEKVFSGKSEDVEYVPAEQAIDRILEEFGGKTLEELELSEQDLLKRKAKKFASKKLEKVLNKFIVQGDELTDDEPRFPFGGEPREYQKEAYQKWVGNDYKGIFAMATGTGKTITSLNCVLSEFKKSKKYNAVIVVPTIALVQQWKEECKNFNFKNVVTIDSKSNWQADLSFHNTASKYISSSLIIIITYSSFHRTKFQDYFKSLDSNTIFIADEAHNLGAGKVAGVLNQIHLGKRIGLSATINRQFDDEGNNKIQDFFNDTPPFIVNYSMAKALSNGWLCKYFYYPHLVELNAEELERYVELSKKLMFYFDSKTGNFKNTPEVETLRLMRKQIIHKAGNKLSKFKEILNQEFDKRGDLKYSLIYVPEGNDPRFDTSDELEESSDDIALINQYTRAISDIDFSILVKQYTSNIKDRNLILKDFETGELHALTSMKCLDEGVDVPRSELAIFCASTGNPRQFIQRRGRVLRNHKDKNYAYIHDLVVVPKIENNSNLFSFERSIATKELERVVDFAYLAENPMDTYQELEPVLDYYGLNLFDMMEKIKND